MDQPFRASPKIKYFSRVKMNTNSIYFIALLFAVTIFILEPYISEQFTGTISSKGYIKVSLDEYANDIRYFAAYVGFYVSGVYADRRARLFNDMTGFGVGNSWAPRGDLNNVDQIMLKNDDNILSTARFQLKVYLDSMAKYLNDKYPNDLINNTVWNMYYVENPENGVLRITYIENGNETSYLV